VKIKGWKTLEQTENFLRIRQERKGMLGSIIDWQEVLKIAEIAKKKGFKTHFENYAWDATIILEKEVKP